MDLYNIKDIEVFLNYHFDIIEKSILNQLSISPYQIFQLKQTGFSSIIEYHFYFEDIFKSSLCYLNYEAIFMHIHDINRDDYFYLFETVLREYAYLRDLNFNIDHLKPILFNMSKEILINILGINCSKMKKFTFKEYPFIDTCPDYKKYYIFTGIYGEDYLILRNSFHNLIIEGLSTYIDSIETDFSKVTIILK